MTEAPNIAFPKNEREGLGINEQLKNAKSNLKHKINSLRIETSREEGLHSMLIEDDIEAEIESVSKGSVAIGGALCAAGIALLFSGELVPIMIGGSMIFAGGNKIKEPFEPQLREWFAEE